MRRWSLPIWLVLTLLASASLQAQNSRIHLRMDTGEAEAALAILDARVAHGAAPDSLWARLEASEGYQRLVAREKAMGRSITVADMRSLLLNDTILGHREALRRTLDSWRVLPVDQAGALALAYLPDTTVLAATVYLLIKPRSNSFVFDLSGKPALMLYLNSETSAPEFANTLAHELHHIGMAAACQARPAYADTTAKAGVTRDWLSAFGEGLAMLAAAGGPDRHPHRDSPAAVRLRWDREMGEAETQMKAVEAFLLDLLEGRLTDPAKQTEKGMEFFGVQGPWYTLGYRMWSTVERKYGRARVINDACRPAQLLLDYNRALAGDSKAPLWSTRLSGKLPGLLETR